MQLDVEPPARPPLTVKFEIPYFTVSGIQVRYLKIVEKSGYQALPWVRYITQNGDDYRWVSPVVHEVISYELSQSQSPYSGRKRQRAASHADVDVPPIAGFRGGVYLKKLISGVHLFPCSIHSLCQ